MTRHDRPEYPIYSAQSLRDGGPLQTITHNVAYYSSPTAPSCFCTFSDSTG